MLSYNSKLDRIFQASETLLIDDRCKIVIISDCHRGSGSFADDFAGNKVIYYAALEHYNRLRYTYIELGDGDELWKNNKMPDIYSVHSDVFALLEQFYRDKRLYMLCGNHDILKKNKQWLAASLNGMAEKCGAFYKDIPMLEGLVIRYDKMDGALFLVHGHQVDFINDTLWPVTRFFVRYLWKPLELIGFRDPTSASKNNKVKEKVEKRLTAWAEQRGTPIVAGHTHRPVFPEPGEGRYFNDGCCIHPWSITALEIVYGAISLVRWVEKARPDGTVYIGRDILAGPRELREYLI